MSEGQQAAQEATNGNATQAAATTENASQESTQSTENRSEAQAIQEQNTEAIAEAQEASSVEELPKWARDEIKALRKENARRRTQDQQRESSEQTELQTVSQERDELRTENDTLKRQVRRSAFIESIGLPNARAAWALANDLGIEVEWDENHRPVRLADVRKRLREEDPALFGNGSADGGSRTNAGLGYQGAPGPDRIGYAYAKNSN